MKRITLDEIKSVIPQQLEIAKELVRNGIVNYSFIEDDESIEAAKRCSEDNNTYCIISTYDGGITEELHIQSSYLEATILCISLRTIVGYYDCDECGYDIYVSAL